MSRADGLLEAVAMKTVLRPTSADGKGKGMSPSSKLWGTGDKGCAHHRK